MSSTVSCSRAAHSVAVSSRMPAQIFATPTGCTMKSSPLARRWSAWRSQEKRNARSTASRSICSAASPRCSSTTAKRSPSRTRWASVSLVFGPAGVCLSCLSTGRCRKSRSGALVRPLPEPFAAGFFLAVVARGFEAGARVVRLVARVPSFVAALAAAGFAGAAAGFAVPSVGFAAAARFAAGFLARSRVLAFPPVRGSLGIGSSLERTPTLLP